jgi:hypothetical protein
MKNFKLSSSSLIRFQFVFFAYEFFFLHCIVYFPHFICFLSTHVLWVMQGFLAIGKKLHDPHSLYIYTYSVMC